MPDPQRLGSTDLVARIDRILTQRGIVPVPVSDDPDPSEPGHPEFHRRRRVEFAMTRWTAATPRRYQHATATHPDVIAWATSIAEALQRTDDEPVLVSSLLLTGTTGTGKTHQAYGALRLVAESAPRRPYAVIATTTADMYGALRPTGQIGAAEQYLNRLCEVPLLLLDDLGSAKASEWTEEVTYRVINERYNRCLPTAFTSNLPPRSKDGRDLTATLGDRIVSRLAEMTKVIPMAGADRRRIGGAA
ncbi:ATP-binding protein [Streptomyces sp. XM4011]|uniref:ATP-binding protein n=1 Tax=Streptomyces sp. XM4011 TaxID=2929780 RepID=UPI001FF7C5BB|nr:ATP-binding protein [Streptomyces sp. XM4011]MCK1813302.1 ATP-binding protein [Streptomyces sp. XM4011]